MYVSDTGAFQALPGATGMASCLSQPTPLLQQMKNASCMRVSRQDTPMFQLQKHHVLHRDGACHLQRPDMQRAHAAHACA